MAELGITLTDEELIYLIGEFDGDIIPGISDPFAEMDENERTDAILEVEDTLQERGYRKRIFGGEPEYDENLVAMINICAGFRHYIGLDKRGAQEYVVTERLYERDGKWLQISGGPEEFCLVIRDIEEIKKIINDIPTDNKSRSNQISILIPRSEFESISELIQNGEEEEIEKSITMFNLDEFNEKFLIDGLSYNLAYAAITLVLRENGNVEAESVAALISEDAMAEFYTSVNDDFETMIGLRMASRGEWSAVREVIEGWLIV